MAKQYSTHDIQSFNDSWEVNPIDGLPQTGRQVREFLGRQQTIYLTEREWDELTDNRTDYSRLEPGREYAIYEEEELGGTASYNFDSGELVPSGTYNTETGQLTLNGSYNVETATLTL